MFTPNSNDLPIAGGTMMGQINMNSNKIVSMTDPASAQDAATKNYVDTVASALNPLQAVYAASTGNYPGVLVGNVLTITATGAISIDGTSPTQGVRVLLKDQSTGAQNGIYDLTTVGSVGVSPVLTRSSDYNTAASVNAGDLIPVINGTVNATTSWLQTATIVTINVTALVFSQWTANPANYLLKANNLSDVTVKATAFNNLSPMTTGGDLIYGAASGAGTRLANGSSGQVLTSSGTTVAPVWAAPAAIGAAAFSASSTAKTSGFTAIGNNLYLLDGSGGTFAATFDVASGYSGQMLAFTRTDNTPSKPISLVVNGSTTVHSVTLDESWLYISDGANWRKQQHFARTNWASFGVSITSNAGGVNPVLSSTLAISTASWRRVGDSMEYKFTYRQLGSNGTTAGSGVYLFQNPPGITYNVNLINTIGASLATNKPALADAVGFGSVESSGDSSNGLAVPYVYDATSIAVLMNFGTGQWIGVSTATSSYKLTSANDLAYTFYTKPLPILNWEP